ARAGRGGAGAGGRRGPEAFRPRRRPLRARRSGRVAATGRLSRRPRVAAALLSRALSWGAKRAATAWAEAAAAAPRAARTEATAARFASTASIAPSPLPAALAGSRADARPPGSAGPAGATPPQWAPRTA